MEELSKFPLIIHINNLIFKKKIIHKSLLNYVKYPDYDVKNKLLN